MEKAEDMKSLFSARLAALLEENRLTQAELAKILGVSESTVGKWVLRKSLPRMGVIQKLADHFKVGKSYFLEETPTTKKAPAPKMKEQEEIDPEMQAIFDNIRNNTLVAQLNRNALDASDKEIKDTTNFLAYLKSQNSNKKEDQ